MTTCQEVENVLTIFGQSYFEKQRSYEDAHSGSGTVHVTYKMDFIFVKEQVVDSNTATRVLMFFAIF